MIEVRIGLIMMGVFLLGGGRGFLCLGGGGGGLDLTWIGWIVAY